MTLKKITRIGVYGIALEGSLILLVHKGENGCYRGLFDLPGGGIEFGETPEQALRREFLEEVAMSFEKMHLFNNFSHCGDVTNMDPPFTFHQLGHVYSVHGVRTSDHHFAQDVFNWYNYMNLRKEQLTPFAWEVVERLQKKECSNVPPCC